MRLNNKVVKTQLSTKRNRQVQINALRCFTYTAYTVE